ncbi:MAG: hypothetical protein WCV92_03020 [Candidatus Buchananbacteria bacterium]
MQKIPQVYFISGVSGVGKSSVLKHLKEIIPVDEYNIRDFDERGVPDGGGLEWHNNETFYWLEVANENAKHKKSTIICGFADPVRFWKIYNKEKHIPATLILLHASAETIRDRLLGRYPTSESIKEINRASGVQLDEFIENNISYAPVLYDIFKKENSPIIETDNKTPLEIAQEIIKIIQK